MSVERYDGVMVFSATKARDREELGQRVTDWIRSNEVSIIGKRVLLTSDRTFHCLTIVLFWVAAT